MTANPSVRCPLCHSSKVSVALDTPVRTDYRCDYCGKRWTVTAAMEPAPAPSGKPASESNENGHSEE